MPSVFFSTPAGIAISLTDALTAAEFRRRSVSLARSKPLSVIGLSSTFSAFGRAIKRRVTEANFTRTLELRDLQDISTECEFSVSSGDVVKLDAVIIEGRRFTPDFILEWLGEAQIDVLEAAGQEFWSSDGWREAEADYMDGLGDHLYEQRRERDL